MSDHFEDEDTRIAALKTWVAYVLILIIAMMICEKGPSWLCCNSDGKLEGGEVVYIIYCLFSTAVIYALIDYWRDHREEELTDAERHFIALQGN